MLLKASKTVDQELQDLITDVGRSAELSYERQKALDRLLMKIQRLPNLLKSPHPNFPEALNLTWAWVSRNIHNFDTQPPLLQERLVVWINAYLRWRIRDLYTPDKHYTFSLDRPLRNRDDERVTMLDLLPDPKFPLSLTLLDIHILKLQTDEHCRIGLEIERYIQRDPDGKLQRCHPRQHANCHCQLLAQRLLLQEPPDRLVTVAEEFGINYQTLNSHWKQKCLPLLQEICRNFGYQSWTA